VTSIPFAIIIRGMNAGLPVCRLFTRSPLARG